MECNEEVLKELVRQATNTLQNYIAVGKAPAIEELHKELTEIKKTQDNNDKEIQYYLGKLDLCYSLLGGILAKRKKEVRDNSFDNTRIDRMTKYLMSNGKTMESKLASDLGIPITDLFILVNNSILEGNSDIIMTLDNHEVFYQVDKKVISRKNISRFRNNEDFIVGE